MFMRSACHDVYARLVTCREPAIGTDHFDTTVGELTPYRGLDEVLVDYARMSREVLGGKFVGLYLLGSLAVGDFDLTSDVDFMVVITRELNTGEVDGVQACHTELISRDCRWVKHLEYSFFPLRKLAERSSPYDENGRRNAAEVRQLWYFANGGATIERSDHDNTLVTRWTLNNRSRAVCGPEPSSFAQDVSVDELRREIRGSMLGWARRIPEDASLHNRFHQVFLVLNNCRALQDLHEGMITSKREGVAWAKRHLDRRWRPLIDYCWRERQDTAIHISQSADPWAWRETLAFVEYTTRLAERYELPELRRPPL
jgi:hypothetical protein